MKRTSVRLSPELKADLMQLAKEHERSMHGEIVYAFRLYLKQQQKAKAS